MTSELRPYLFEWHRATDLAWGRGVAWGWSLADVADSLRTRHDLDVVRGDALRVEACALEPESLGERPWDIAERQRRALQSDVPPAGGYWAPGNRASHLRIGESW